MLKLNAAFAKKIPAEGDYSSQSYHASIEVELPDGLTQEQLQTRIHETFDLVRNSVEAELHGKLLPKQTVIPSQEQPRNSVQTAPSSHAGNHDVPASSKQIKYLLDLARNIGMTPAQIAARYNVPSVQDLTKAQCYSLINEWKAA